jgi:hypothetical protein
MTFAKQLVYAVLVSFLCMAFGILFDLILSI